MKKTHFIIIVAIAVLGACKKKGVFKEEEDNRGEVLGTYSGIRINSTWTGVPGPNFVYDTTYVTCQIAKGAEIDLVNFGDSNESYSFSYKDGNFSNQSSNYNATLKKTGDSLFFLHGSGHAPGNTRMKLKKQS